MKVILLFMLSLWGLSYAYGQKFETNFQASAGAYHYSGASATPTSYFVANGDNTYYTNNVYGSKAGFSYGAAIQSQFVAKGGFIVGLQAGYDLLRSNQTITEVQPQVFFLDNDYGPEGSFASTRFPVKGQASLQNQYINLSPYVGYRFKIGKLNLDLMPGADIAFNQRSYDKGKATDAQNNVYRTNFKKVNAPTDVRLKFGAALGYKKWLVTASYAHGLTNLDKDIDDSNGQSGNFTAHSELLRFGLGYLLK